MNCLKSSIIAEITPIILAGGRGTRLQTVVSDLPKVLAPVCGRPFLSYLLDRLAAVGFRRVVLSTGYMAEKIFQTFGERYGDMAIVHSRESEPLGTGGGLRLACEMVETRVILAMNGDCYTDADIAAFIEVHFRNGYRASILAARVDDTSRYGRIAMAEDGRVLSFEEKALNTGGGWVNAGVYILTKELVETMPTNGSVSLEKDFLPGLIDGGLYAHAARADFIDIGTPESYGRTDLFFGQRTSK